jgi:hypothetical protein
VKTFASSSQTRKLSRVYLGLAIIVTMAIVMGLCAMYSGMRAIRHDTSANFWYATTGVDLGVTPSHLSSQSYCIYDRGRFVYGEQYQFHVYPDFPYQSISEDEAAVDLARVQAELDKRVALNSSDDWAATGYRRWMAIPVATGNIPALIECLQAAYLEWGNQQLPVHVPRSRLEFREGLNHVVKADRLYWVCFVFEGLYLPAVVWFVLWPYIRRGRLRQKFLHVAVLPLLLMLPYWFGYCNSASPAFPRGGILYPFICGLSSRFPDNYDLEFRFLAALPPFLSVITQGRVVTFADYFSLRVALPYQNGPVKVAMLSVFLTSLLGAYHGGAYGLKKWRERRNLGLCPNCRYDLRAHQPGQRCPECGTVIGSGSKAAT